MAIRKSDLRDFIENKARKRKAELRMLVYSAVESAVKPVIFKKYEGAATVEALADKLHTSLLQLQEQYKHFRDKWPITRVIRELDSEILCLRMDIVKNQTNAVVHNLIDFGTNGYMKEIEETVASVAESQSKTISEYKDLVKLTDELTSIIDSSRNGDKAYKRLEELGVDLSGFEEAGKNLPAVVKLSVNPCVLNGNCG